MSDSGVDHGAGPVPDPNRPSLGRAAQSFQRYTAEQSPTPGPSSNFEPWWNLRPILGPAAKSAVVDEPAGRPPFAGAPSLGPAVAKNVVAQDLQAAPKRSTGRSAGIRLVAFGLAGLVTALLANWISSVYSNSMVFGVMASTALAILAVGVALIVWREMAAVRRLREAGETRRVIATAHRNPDDAARVLIPVAQRLGEQLAVADAAEKWQRGLRSKRSADEIRQSFESEVLGAADALAIQAIARSARASGALTMLSPSPAGDFLLFGWRAVCLLREIAIIYGLRPGRVAELAMLRQALADGTMLSAADLATDVASGAMGRVTGMLIGTAAQGGLAAYRMSRFGLLAIGVCRPMPFSQAMAPTVADVMKKAWSGGEAGKPEAKHDCRKD